TGRLSGEDLTDELGAPPQVPLLHEVAGAGVEDELLDPWRRGGDADAAAGHRLLYHVGQALGLREEEHALRRRHRPYHVVLGNVPCETDRTRDAELGRQTLERLAQRSVPQDRQGRVRRGALHLGEHPQHVVHALALDQTADGDDATRHL